MFDNGTKIYGIAVRGVAAGGSVRNNVDGGCNHGSSPTREHERYKSVVPGSF